MNCVVLSTLLARDLPTEEAVILVNEFRLWKDGGIGAGDTFGKDTAFARPKSVVDAGIRKVHMEGPRVSVAWDRKLRAGEDDPQAYTSDKILVYAHLGDLQQMPYLLLAILEPGHAQMADPSLVRGLATLYDVERAAFARTFPGSLWITSGFP